MKQAIKTLRELGCQVEKKFRTGEFRITLPSGIVMLASSTRKDTPGHVKMLIRKMKNETSIINSK